MGFELDRLMRQYGVSTATMQRYSGAAAPTGAAPTAPTELVAPTLRAQPVVGSAPKAPGRNATQEQQQAYQTALGAFNAAKTDLANWNGERAKFNTEKKAYDAALPKYNTDLAAYNTAKAAFDTSTDAFTKDQAAYNAYMSDYRNRMSTTPMYLQAQFNTQPQTAAPKTASDLYQRYLQREPDEAGLANWQQQFGEQLSPQEIQQFIAAARPEMQQRGLNQFGRQFYEDTGSYFGDQLRAPVMIGGGSSTSTGVTGTTPTGVAGPSGQSLEFRQGVRGYYLPADEFDAPTSNIFGGQPAQNPRGVPAGAIYDQSRKTYFVPFAKGGAVKGYSKGGLKGLESKYTDPTPMPQQPMASPDLAAMLEKYVPAQDYSADLKSAKANVASKAEAFNNMLKTALQEEAAPSKAEMYWRLAAAFGSPTRTGAFGENLALAGKEMAEYERANTEAKRASKNTKLQLGLKGAELELSGAKEELEAAREMQKQGMLDKRSIATELVRQYVKSGEPESAAGKQAKDEGLKVGTPEFQRRVAEIAKSNLDAQTTRIESLLAGMSVQQANLALAQGKFGLEQEKFGLEKEKAAKLTPAEVKLKTDTEDLLASSDQALKMLQQAYKLNPNTFDASLTDVAQRKLLEITSSNDPKVKATRVMENLLAKDALAKLKASFGANPTEGERKVILDLEGIGAKSKEERKEIMLSAFEALKTTRSRYQKRLNEITKGLYRDTNAPGSIE